MAASTFTGTSLSSKRQVIVHRNASPKTLSLRYLTSEKEQIAGLKEKLSSQTSPFDHDLCLKKTKRLLGA